MEFFTPGRVELCGNHTDHNNGMVLAAAVNIGISARAVPNGTNEISIRSEGYGEFCVSLDALSPAPDDAGPVLILKGVLSRFRELGYDAHGFDCEMSSDIPEGSGLSSSAAYEVALCRIISALFNRNALDALTIAGIARYAENVFFGKPCGLMDQLTCAATGLIAIDFSGKTPTYERLDSTLTRRGYDICVVSAGGGHEGLTNEYAAIPADMARVAAALGVRTLSEAEPELFWERFSTLHDRLPALALMRAAHFYAENERVRRAARCVSSGDMTGLLRELDGSGRSSFEYLQNVYTPERPELALALCLAQRLLDGRGAARVHGGGFAGTILALVPNDMPEFAARMGAVFGTGACRTLEIYEGA